MVGRTRVEWRGRDPGFVDRLVKIPGRWRPGEFGSSFVASTRD